MLTHVHLLTALLPAQGVRRQAAAGATARGRQGQAEAAHGGGRRQKVKTCTALPYALRVVGRARRAQLVSIVAGVRRATMYMRIPYDFILGLVCVWMYFRGTHGSAQRGSKVYTYTQHMHQIAESIFCTLYGIGIRHSPSLFGEHVRKPCKLSRASDKQGI